MNHLTNGIDVGLIPLQYRDINYQRLNRMGCHFGILHLRQIAGLGVITPEALAYSIDALELAIMINWEPPGLPEKTYIEAFMDAIRTYGVFEFPGYRKVMKDVANYENEVKMGLRMKQYPGKAATASVNGGRLADDQRDSDDFSELQRVILVAICATVDRESLISAKIDRQTLAQAINRSNESVKSGLRRLIEIGAIERVDWKDGMNGWTRYKVPQRILSLVEKPSNI